MSSARRSSTAGVSSTGDLVVCRGLDDGRRARCGSGGAVDERVVGALGEDHVVGEQHVVGVQLVDGEQVHRGDVAQREPGQRVVTLEHDELATVAGQAGQRCDGVLGRRLVATEQRLHHVDAAGAGPVGEGAAQGGGLHLLGRALVVVTRLRAVDDATAGELRCAGRALAGAAGALLLVGLAATAANLAAGLGRVRALASSGLLADDDLVDQRDVGLDVEDLGGEINLHGRTGFLGGHAPASSVLFAAERITTSPPLGPGTAPLSRIRPFSDVHGVHGDVLRGHGVGTHATGHPHALEDTAGGRAGADGAGLAVVAVGTVGGADAVEAVTLHDTGVALALAGAGDVDVLAGGEQLGAELLADLVGRGVTRADLGDVAARGHAGLAEVTGGRLGDLGAVDLAEADLDGVVAVLLGGADLGHHVGAGRDHGHGDDAVVLVPGLGHAELGAQQSLDVAFEGAHVSNLRA